MMKKVNLILSALILMAILPLVSADVPTVADSCWKGAFGVDTWLNTNCTYGSDGDFSTQTGMTEPYQRNDVFYNYTFPYGFGDQTNVTFYFIHNDLGSGQYDGAIGCVNKSLDMGSIGNNIPPSSTTYFSQQILYGDSEGLHNESYTWTIPNECLRDDNTVTLKVYQGIGDNNEFSQYDIVFTGGGEPLPFPEISITFPLNQTYESNVTELNYTIYNGESCWYSTDLGVTNNSITCGNNVTGLNADSGSYTWIVYANNSENSLNYSVVTFSVEIPLPTPTPEVEEEDILSTVLISSGEGLGAFLTSIKSPLLSIVLIISLIGGVIIIVFSIASLIKGISLKSFSK